MGEQALGYGYVGLGEMGGAMCGNLLGHGEAVTVFDLDPAAVQRQVDAGAAVAASVADLARASDVVSICVPADAHVRAVMTGPDGIEAGAHDGLTVLIHSTVHPDTMREMHELGARWGVSVHDCCVTGGEVGAKAGELALFVSRAEDLSDRARHLLDIYGTLLIPTGPPGSGAAVKIGNNVLTFAMQAAVHAALQLVEAQGASRDVLLEAWRHNEQLSPIIERFLVLFDFGPDVLAGMSDYLSNVVSIEQKDLELALDLGEGTPAGPSPVVAAVRDQLPVVFGLRERPGP